MSFGWIGLVGLFLVTIGYFLLIKWLYLWLQQQIGLKLNLIVSSGVTFLGTIVLLMAFGGHVLSLKPEPMSTINSTAQAKNLAEASNLKIVIDSSQAELIGHKIWLNETSGKLENLIVWNDGEDFVSSGIGHFIWFPEERSSPFQESFH